MTRQHHTVQVQAKWGCNRCSASGQGANSKGLAARHHDQKHHQTWVEETWRTTYGVIAGKTIAGETQGSML